VSRFFLAIVLVAAAAVGATASAAAPRPGTLYAFGRTGGNIRPFTVNIGVDGAVKVNGPIQAQRRRLTHRQLTALAAALQRARLSTLPPTTLCTGTLPDIAARAITAPVGRVTKTVLVRGDCKPGFNAAFAALSSAVLLRNGP
jgi:hypothetical protein